MYAHMEHVNSQPGPGTGGRDSADLTARVAGQRGLLGCISLQQLAGSAAVRLTLWDTENNASEFMATRARFGTPAGAIYKVGKYEQGPAAAHAATHARLLYFDGPRTPEQVAASDFGGRQRVWPAIRGLSGLVSVYLLRGHDLGWIVVTFATSVATLDAAQRTVMATDLLPGEDRALLPGPDRIEIHNVTGYQVQAAGQHASISGR
jgi:hypothetical protein